MSTLWLLLGSEVSTSKHDLFKHRECRQRRGDVADIPNLLTAAPSHPRNLKVNSENALLGLEFDLREGEVGECI